MKLSELVKDFYLNNDKGISLPKLKSWAQNQIKEWMKEVPIITITSSIDEHNKFTELMGKISAFRENILEEMK